MARWKAWLCTFAMPGTTGPASLTHPAGGAAPAFRSVIVPLASTLARTLSDQPSGSSAQGRK